MDRLTLKTLKRKLIIWNIELKTLPRVWYSDIKLRNYKRL